MTFDHRFYKPAALLFCTMIAGCAIYRTKRAPDKKGGLAVTCSSGEFCKQQAARVCPQGYEVLSQSDRTTTFLEPRGDYHHSAAGTFGKGDAPIGLAGSPVVKMKWTIRCHKTLLMPE